MNIIDLETYDDWVAYRNDFFRANPTNSNHLRIDIELALPSKTLCEVPISFNPHIGGYHGRQLFYNSDLWWPVSDICKIEEGENNPSLKLIVESIGLDNHIPDRFKLFDKYDDKFIIKNQNFEDNIILMSTASTIYHEWWAARKNWNDFAFYQGNHWKITWNEPLSGWPADRWRKDRSVWCKGNRFVQPVPDAPWGVWGQLLYSTPPVIDPNYNEHLSGLTYNEDGYCFDPKKPIQTLYGKKLKCTWDKEYWN